MTVTVVAVAEAWLKAADTVVVPPFSEIELFASVNVTVGVSSSSLIVPVPVAVPSSALVAPLSVSFTVSSGSSSASPVTRTVTVLYVSPAAKVSVPEGTAA